MPCLLLFHGPQEYAANPAANWKAKDCAVYLVLAVTVKGKTGEKGATSMNRLVQIDVFFEEQVGCVREGRPTVLPVENCLFLSV